MLNPWGDRKQDWRFAMLAHVFCRVMADKYRGNIEDFIPDYTPAQVRPWSDTVKALTGFAAMHNKQTKPRQKRSKQP